MTNIVILGGGFGGIRAALDLEKKLGKRQDIKIILIDKNNEQTFYPSLYEVASVFGVDHEHPFHTKIRGTIAIPYNEIFKNKKVELVEAEVSHISLEGNHITTNGGNIFPFDYLVIALGSVVSTFGIPGVEEYAYKFKSLEDGLILADKIERLYEDAGQGKINLPIRIIVSGAGFTGIELAAELSNCLAHVAHRHGIQQKNCTSIILVEAGQVILPAVSSRERSLIKERLNKLGINLLENSPITEVSSNQVKVANGQVAQGDLIVWTAGVKAADIVKRTEGMELDERDRIIVNDYLEVNGKRNVFAIGDAVLFIDKKTVKSIPQMAYLAIEQGKVAAENISRLINFGGDRQTMILKKYEPVYNIWIAPVGGKYAIAHVGGWTISGYFGYLIRELVDCRYFLSILPLFKAIRLFLTDIKIFSRND